MPRLTPATVAAMILTSPAWARVGLTVSDHRLRERAANEMAARVVSMLDEPEPDSDDPRQRAPASEHPDNSIWSSFAETSSTTTTLHPTDFTR